MDILGYLPVSPRASLVTSDNSDDESYISENETKPMHLWNLPIMCLEDDEFEELYLAGRMHFSADCWWLREHAGNYRRVEPGDGTITWR